MFVLCIAYVCVSLLLFALPYHIKIGAPRTIAAFRTGIFSQWRNCDANAFRQHASLGHKCSGASVVALV